MNTESTKDITYKFQPILQRKLLRTRLTQRIVIEMNKKSIFSFHINYEAGERRKHFLEAAYW